MGRGILRGAGGDENLKFNFIWPYDLKVIKNLHIFCNLKIYLNLDFQLLKLNRDSESNYEIKSSLQTD